jgi:hypothetical protein
VHNTVGGVKEGNSGAELFEAVGEELLELRGGEVELVELGEQGGDALGDEVEGRERVGGRGRG